MAKVRVLAGVWTTDTSTGESVQQNDPLKMAPELGLRLEMVRAMTWRAHSWIRQRKESGPKAQVPCLEVFIAPEYIFSCRPDQLLFTAKQKTDVEEMARFLSEQFEMLVIPGTVTWKKPLDPTADPTSKGNKSQTHRLDKAEQRMRGDLDLRYKALVGESKAAESYDQPAQAEYGNRVNFFNRDVSMLKGDLKTLAEIRQKPVKDVSLAMNTAFAYYKGDRLLKYHKRGNSAEVLQKDRNGGDVVIFVPGERDGLFTVPGLNLDCGLEVCYDHRIGYVSLNQQGKVPHIHFITSAMVWVEPARVRVKPGGIIVHASSSAQASGVFSSDCKPIQPTDNPSGWAGTLLCYDLTLDIAT